MGATFTDPLRATASDLLTGVIDPDLPVTVTYRSRLPGVYSPATGLQAFTTVDMAVAAVVRGYSTKEIAESAGTIEQGDVRISVSRPLLEAIPPGQWQSPRITDPNDQIILDGHTLQIVSVTDRKIAEVTVFQCRE